MLTETIISEAKRITEKFGTRDPFSICSAMGIRIRYMDLKGRIKGYFFYQSRISNIVIDESLSEPFARILAAHELGHAVLHKELAMLKGFADLEVLDAYGSEYAPERDANIFAAELLLDDAETIETLKEHTFFETASILNVPAALLDYKFYTLQKKGYSLTPLQIARADFLKD